MADGVSDHNSNHSSRDSSGHGHRHHTRGLLKSRHHKRSKREKRVKDDSFSEGRHKFRIEEQHLEDRWRKIETVLTRNFLKIIGGIFLLNAVWFILSSSAYFHRILSFVTHIIMNFGKVMDTHESTPVPDLKFQSILLVYFFVAVLIFLAMRYAVKKRNFELEITTFCSWIVLAIWWIAKIITAPSLVSIMGFLAISTLFFLAIFYIHLLSVFPMRRTITRRMESGVIFVNYFFYFFSGIFAMKLLGWGRVTLIFALLLAVVAFLPLFIAAKKRRHYNSIPFMISTALIASFVLPMAFRMNFAILYLAPLSVFLLLISKATRNQVAILLSIASMLSVFMIYIFQWVFEYIPGCFITNILLDNKLFLQGLVSGLVIIPVYIINNILLKKLTISLSSKLFSRSNYRKVLKGTTLGIIYLTGFWIFNYSVQFLLDIDDMNYMILFTYNCLYFIIVIPYLVRTGSSFLRIILITGMGLSFLYPILIQSYNLKFRDSFLLAGNPWMTGFSYHYLNLVLFLVMLFVMLRTKTRAFARKKMIIRGFWVYFVLMICFLVVTEIRDLVFLYGRSKGVSTVEVLDQFGNLIDSILIIVSAIVFLAIGFVQRFRFLRIFSLLIVACVLIKVLAIDIYSLENTAKVIIFVVLGTLVLGLSVLYPKFKKYLFQLESESAEKKNDE